MSTLHAPHRIDGMNLVRLPLESATGQITLQVVNGKAQGPEAFVARVGFRDAEGVLILPPYPGFSQLLDGFCGFYVAGGTPEAPGLTRYGFGAPPGARQIEIELRRNRCPEQPRVSAGPDLVSAAHTTPPTQIYQLAMADDVVALKLAVANGKAAGKKAFVACVRFLDIQRDEIPPPHAGFTHSLTLGSYVYLPGGTRSAPALVKHPFRPPHGAVTMEIKLRTWDMKEPIALSGTPGVIHSRAAAQADKAAPAEPADYLNLHLASPPMGSQILATAVAARRITGIMGDALRAGLGERAASAPLPFDRYDLAWGTPVPGYLVIEPGALAQNPGWEHALTLRDPPATVELAVMLRKARAAGIRTVLVSPRETSRFPLLSRVAGLFDVTLPPEADVAEALD